MIDDAHDDDVATPEEQAEAEALARALDGQPVFRTPTDALEAVALVRFDRVEQTVIEARVRGVRAELAHEFAQRPGSAGRSRIAVATFVLASAAVLLLVVRTARPVATESTSTPVAFREAASPTARTASRAGYADETAPASNDPSGFGEMSEATASAERAPESPTPPGVIAESSHSVEIAPAPPGAVGDVARDARDVAALERAMRIERGRMFATLRATFRGDARTSRWLRDAEVAHRRADVAPLGVAREILEDLDDDSRGAIDQSARAVVLGDVRFRRAALALTSGDARAAIRIVSESDGWVGARSASEELRRFERTARANLLFVGAAAYDTLGETGRASSMRARARALSMDR